MALVVVFSRLKSREVFVWWVVGSGEAGRSACFTWWSRGGFPQKGYCLPTNTCVCDKAGFEVKKRTGRGDYLPHTLCQMLCWSTGQKLDTQRARSGHVDTRLQSKHQSSPEVTPGTEGLRTAAGEPGR